MIFRSKRCLKAGYQRIDLLIGESGFGVEEAVGVGWHGAFDRAADHGR